MIDRARDELFSHIQRCGVLDAEDEQRDEWLDDTLEYLGERYPQLSRDDLAGLRMMGQRYCSPAIRRRPKEDEAEDEALNEDVVESSPAEPEAAGEDGEVEPGEVSVA
jgi:hypothetical protein